MRNGGRSELFGRVDPTWFRIGSNRLYGSAGIFLTVGLFLSLNGAETLLKPSRLWPAPVLIRVGRI